MFHLVGNFQNKSGDALVGYYVKLKDSVGAYATLYSDANSTPIATVSGVANAAVTDATGMYDLWVADGTYDVEFFDKNDMTRLVNRSLAVQMAVPDATLRADLSADTGLAAIGAVGGVTAQAALDAKASLAGLSASSGSSILGFIQAGTGAVARTAQDKLREIVSVKDFGAVGDGATDNTAAFAAAAAYAATVGAGCTISFPPGVYNYATSPNWAIPLLELRCAQGVWLYHTGTGVAFNLDGGATGDGVYRFRLTGRPVIRGNANTTYCIDLRAVHSSHITAVLRDATTALIRTRWAVCDTFEIEGTGLAFGGFSPQPVNCVVLDQRGAGEQTSACVFTNLRLSHASGAALLLTSSIQNTFIGGAAEVSDGAISINAASSQNTFINFDCEVNTTYDLNCAGSRNTFVNLYSDKLAAVSGDSNNFYAGIFNAVTVDATGDGNQFWGVAYAANAGLFTDNGTRTGKSKVRNQTTNNFDNDIFTLPTDAWLLDGAGAQRLYFAAANTNYYKATLNHIFRDNTDAHLLEIDTNGLKLLPGDALFVNSQQVVGGRLAALPADATDLATALTLVNAIKARLKTTGGHGLVAD